MSELEKQMAELLAGTATVAAGAKEAGKVAAKTRRRSRDLDTSFEAIASSAVASFSVLATPGKELSDSEIEKIFKEIDTDGSGKLGKDELLKAIKQADPKATTELAEDMVAFADKNGDGEVDLEEFKAVLRTKPEDLKKADDSKADDSKADDSKAKEP